jgi:hypothetical protein
VIVKAEMMSLLGSACPSFVSARERSARHWKDEADSIVREVVGDLGLHLIELLQRGETAEFPAVFSAIERCLLEGDPFVRESAAPGLLETLHAERCHETTVPDQLRPYLGDESLGIWDGFSAPWEDPCE